MNQISIDKIDRKTVRNNFMQFQYQCLRNFIRDKHKMS